MEIEIFFSFFVHCVPNMVILWCTFCVCTKWYQNKIIPPGILLWRTISILMNIRWWIYDEYSLFDPILDPNKFIPTLYYRPPIATWIYSSHIYLHLTLSGWAVLEGIFLLSLSFSFFPQIKCSYTYINFSPLLPSFTHPTAIFSFPILN